MEDSSRELDKRINLVLPITVIFAVIYVLLGWLPKNSWWGINHLYFHDRLTRVIFSVLILAAFWPVVQRLFDSWLGRVMKLSKISGTILIMAVTLAVLYFFRAAVHIMGDGYLRAYEIEHGHIFRPTEMLDFLLHTALFHLLQLFGITTATVAMAATSIVAGVFLVVLLFRLVPFSGWRRTIAIAAILSLGSSQLFFGYVESYTLLYLFGCWYLLKAFQIDQVRDKFGILTLTYILAGFSHLIGLTLLPSYLYLAHLRFRKHPRKYLIAPLVIVVSVLPLIVSGLLGRLLHFQEARSLTDYILPLMDPVYGILSIGHLRDLFNQMLLVIPVALMLLPLFPLVLTNRKKSWLFVLVAAPSALFVVLFNSELTIARDWDLLAVPVSVSAIILILAVLENLPPPRTSAANKLLAPVLVSLLMTASWITINSQADRHLERAEYIIDRSVKNQRYGYEALAHYYSSQTDYVNELRVLRKIKPEDRTARVYAKISQDLYSLGQKEEAFELAIIGVKMENPSSLNAVMAGVTCLDMGLYIDAVFFLRAATELSPRDLSILCKLGDALVEADSLEGAIDVFQQVIERDPRMGRPYYGLAKAYARSGDIATAEKYYHQGYQREPKYSARAATRNMIDELKKSKSDGDN